MESEILSNLNRRGFVAYFAKNKSEAKNTILKLIDENETTAFGGSATSKELDLLEFLKKNNRKFWHHSFLQENETKAEIMKKGFSADWYICSANAITMDGEVVNTDGTGNRVASTIYGPKNVIFVIGKNKIVKDLPEAFERIRNVAAPLNCKRFGIDNPCTKNGSCADCDKDKTICKVTTILHHPTTGKKHSVIIIDENLGF